LCLLNDQLVAAEAWIHQRARQCFEAYYAAVGLKNHRFTGELNEDVEVAANVTCVLRSDHADFDADDDNVVAELDAANLFVDAWLEGFDFAELGGADGRLPPLSEV
jgi:hypothetical protein